MESPVRLCRTEARAFDLRRGDNRFNSLIWFVPFFLGTCIKVPPYAHLPERCRLTYMRIPVDACMVR